MKNWKYYLSDFIIYFVSYHILIGIIGFLVNEFKLGIPLGTYWLIYRVLFVSYFTYCYGGLTENFLNWRKEYVKDCKNNFFAKHNVLFERSYIVNVGTGQYLNNSEITRKIHHEIGKCSKCGKEFNL